MAASSAADALFDLADALLTDVVARSLVEWCYPYPSWIIPVRRDPQARIPLNWT
jgi:hypothetical protein